MSISREFGRTSLANSRILGCSTVFLPINSALQESIQQSKTFILSPNQIETDIRNILKEFALSFGGSVTPLMSRGLL